MWAAVYLSEELVALVFFDRDVDTSEKRAVIEALSHVGEMVLPRIFAQIIYSFRFMKKDFGTLWQGTQEFSSWFSKFQIRSWECLWHMADKFWLRIRAEDVARDFRVVNYNAERDVAMMPEYNGLPTKDEEQTQFALDRSCQRTVKALRWSQELRRLSLKLIIQLMIINKALLQ